MQLYFSEAPGAWERHLQRQHNNPLFAHCEAVTQTAVNDAQRKDEGERVAFATSFNDLLEKAVALQPQEESDVILKLKSDIDKLYEDCAGLGGDFAAQKEGLKKLNELIMQAIWKSADHNEQAQSELEKETVARKMHFALLEYPLIAHLLRPESPISQMDLVPTLLTEEENSVRAAMSMFDREHQQVLCDGARTLLNALRQQGEALPDAWARLRMMEQPLTQPN